MVDRSRFLKCTDSEVLAVCERLGNAKAVAKEMGIGHSSVLRILAKHGVKSPGRERYLTEARRFSDEQAAVLAERYQAGAIVADLVAEFGGSFYSVKKAIRSQGVTLRENPAPLSRPGELEEILRLRAEGMSQLHISLRVGRSQPFVSKVLVEHLGGLEKRSGERHWSWRGGVNKAGGYLLEQVAKDDPLASMRNSSGYVLQHRLVMARSLGRPLLRSETVHHLNGDGTDNRLENLQLRQGKHGKHVVMVCADCGSHNLKPAKIAD